MEIYPRQPSTSAHVVAAARAADGAGTDEFLTTLLRIGRIGRTTRLRTLETFRAGWIGTRFIAVPLTPQATRT